MSAPLTPVPAIRTIQATSGISDATIGAIRPPSLCPMSPIGAPDSLECFLANSTTALTSSAKSREVAVA